MNHFSHPHGRFRYNPDLNGPVFIENRCRAEFGIDGDLLKAFIEHLMHTKLKQQLEEQSDVYPPYLCCYLTRDPSVQRKIRSISDPYSPSMTIRDVLAFIGLFANAHHVHSKDVSIGISVQYQPPMSCSNCKYADGSEVQGLECPSTQGAADDIGNCDPFTFALWKPQDPKEG
jgi:hypothetical protein